MQAEAIDIRLPGTSTSTFRNAALALKLGGVGYYQLRISFMWTSAGFATGSSQFRNQSSPITSQVRLAA